MTRSTDSKKDLYKISDLARETGVSIGTIKFYLREGLLPPPTLKTGRNMAYYDRSFVDRIRVIKELRQKRFLPLEVIKAILNRDEAIISQREIDTLLRLEGTFYEEVHYAPGQEPLTRTAITERYDVDLDMVRYLIQTGILTPIVRDGIECFEGDDVALLENVAEMQRAGFDEDLISKEHCVPLYVEAIAELAREELKMFSRAVTGKVDEARLPELAMAGVKLAEQFIVLLRRKLLLRAIQDLRHEAEVEKTGTGE
jgi:DNA-binding transcriptional MerR regulator